MADVAAIFHWRPADMEHMTISELMEWRDHARKRSQPEE